VGLACAFACALFFLGGVGGSGGLAELSNSERWLLGWYFPLPAFVILLLCLYYCVPEGQFLQLPKALLSLFRFWRPQSGRAETGWHVRWYSQHNDQSGDMLYDIVYD
jgi:hypothetical protein